MLHTSSNSRKA